MRLGDSLLPTRLVGLVLGQDGSAGQAGVLPEVLCDLVLLVGAQAVGALVVEQVKRLVLGFAVAEPAHVVTGLGWSELDRAVDSLDRLRPALEDLGHSLVF